MPTLLTCMACVFVQSFTGAPAGGEPGRRQARHLLRGRGGRHRLRWGKGLEGMKLCSCSLGLVVLEVKTRKWHGYLSTWQLALWHMGGQTCCAELYSLCCSDCYRGASRPLPAVRQPEPGAAGAGRCTQQARLHPALPVPAATSSGNCCAWCLVACFREGHSCKSPCCQPSFNLMQVLHRPLPPQRQLSAWQPDQLATARRAAGRGAGAQHQWQEQLLALAGQPGRAGR